MAKPDPVKRHAVLTVNKEYKSVNGGIFLCLDSFPEGDAVLQSIMSGYTFVARGISLHKGEKIDWESFSDGRYEPIRRKP